MPRCVLCALQKHSMGTSGWAEGSVSECAGLARMWLVLKGWMLEAGSPELGTEGWWVFRRGLVEGD